MGIHFPGQLAAQGAYNASALRFGKRAEKKASPAVTSAAPGCETGQQESFPKIAPGTRRYLRINKAVRRNNVDKVRCLIDKAETAKLRASLQSKEPGWMLQAASLGHQRMLEFFIDEKGVEPDTKHSNSGMTALTHAAERGDLLMTGYLLKKGANINLAGGGLPKLPWAGYSVIRQHEAFSALSQAILNHHEKTALYLIEKNANVNQSDSLGATPLMHAALAGQVGVMKELVRRGADPEAMDHDGNTVLMMAAAGGSVEALKFLIEDLDMGHNATAGLAVVNESGLIRRARITDDWLDGKKHQQQNALMLAIAHGNSEAMKYLVWCIKPGSGVDINLDITDKQGWPPLMYAAANKRMDMVDYLLDAGANPKFRLEKGDTLLTVAARNGWTDMVKRLIKTGIDINADDSKGFTALMHAVWRNNKEMIAVLREAGAKLKPPGKKGSLYLAEHKRTLPFGPPTILTFQQDAKKLFKPREGKPPKPPLWDEEDKPWLGKRLMLRFNRFTELPSEKDENDKKL